MQILNFRLEASELARRLHNRVWGLRAADLRFLHDIGRVEVPHGGYKLLSTRFGPQMWPVWFSV